MPPAPPTFRVHRRPLPLGRQRPRLRSRPRGLALIVLLAIAVAGPALGLAETVPKGSRILGIDVNEAGDDDYEGAFSRALSAGTQTTSLSLGWDDLETAPGVYDSTYLDIANLFFPAYGTSLYLTLAPIDTNNSRLPPDLAGRSFDDPIVITRFAALLDYLFERLPDLELSTLAIGNEVDIYLGDNGGEWRAWRTFFEAAAAKVATLRPALPVGTTLTYFGLVGPNRDEVVATGRLGDWTLLTYYPLDERFRVRPPETVIEDFRAMVEGFPGRPIAVLEAGYPSSTANGSSEQLQRDFVREVFAAWDQFPEQLVLVSFSWLTDRSDEQVALFQEYYGLDDEAFGEYLRTLGLRTHPGAGADKPAFRELAAQAAARGWDAEVPATACQESSAVRCLSNGRFAVSIDWRSNDGAGQATAVDVASDDSALFWFFEADNWEMLVKVLDGCALNGHYWVFAAATTDVGYTLRVRDTLANVEQTWSSPVGTSAPALAATTAFGTCP